MNRFSDILPGKRHHPLKDLPANLAQAIKETPQMILPPKKKKKFPLVPVIIATNIIALLALAALAFVLFSS